MAAAREESATWAGRAARAAAVAGAWGLAGLVLGLRWYAERRAQGVPVPLGEAVLVWESCAVVWAALTPVVVAVCRRWPLRRGGLARALTAHAATGAVLFCAEWLASDFLRHWWL